MIADIRNRLLRALPDRVRKDILYHAKAVTLPHGRVLQSPDEDIQYIYFLNRGLISLIHDMRDGRSIEVGAFGVEGITSPEALLDSSSAVFTSIVQIPVSGWSVELRSMRLLVERHPSLKDLVHRYFHASIQQLGMTAACNKLHALPKRCCRWLLFAHDSVGESTFRLTQEFLAQMLGAPRSSVSDALAALRNTGAISYSRGRLTILRPAALEALACECHADQMARYDRIFRANR